MRRLVPRTVALIGATSLLTVAAGVFPAVEARADAKDVTVKVTLLHGFDPNPLNVSTGTTVTWHNEDLVDREVAGVHTGAHKLRADDGSFESPLLAPGQGWSMPFLAAKNVTYRCTIHPNILIGQLTVTGPTISPAAAPKNIAIVEPNPSDPNSWTFKPRDLVAVVGTKITWHNNGAVDHNVHADDNSFHSPQMKPGDAFAFTPRKPLSVGYKCTLHPWMIGTLRIAAPGQTAPPPLPRPGRGNPGGSGGVPEPVRQPARSGAAPATFQVHIVETDITAPTSWKFDPSSLGARAGDTVIWTNTGSQQHTVTADDGSFDSGMLGAGAKFTRMFSSPATIAFHCTPHPWMKGVILVAAASTVGPVKAPPPPAPHGDTPGTGTSTDAAGEGGKSGEPLDPKHASRSLFGIAALGIVALLGAATAMPTARDVVLRARASSRAAVPPLAAEVAPGARPAPRTKTRAVAVAVPARVELKPLVIDAPPKPARAKREPVGAGRK
jgi:plastocyanin